MTDPDLSDGPSWTPKRSVFIHRSLILSGTTFASLVLLGLAISYYFSLTFLWIFPSALVFTLGFAIDDGMRWRTAQFDRWQISGRHLIHDGQDGSARIPLAQIDRAFRRYGSNVVIQLTSGQRIVLRYLPYPAETAAQINAAIRC